MASWLKCTAKRDGNKGGGIDYMVYAGPLVDLILGLERGRQ